MRTLSTDEAKTWCAERGLQADAADHVRFAHPRPGGVRVTLPAQAYRLSYLLLQLLEAQADQGAAISGPAHLLWLNDWTLWQGPSAEVGVDLFRRLRQGYGLDADLDERPAILFAGNELADLVAFGVVALVFGWDFYVLPDPGNYLLFGCHDGWIGFSGRSEADETDLAARLEDWDEPPEKYVHYCLAGAGAVEVPVN